MSLTSTVDPYVDEQAEVAPASEVEAPDPEEAQRQEAERERFNAELKRLLEEAAERGRERAAREALAARPRPVARKKLHAAPQEGLLRAARSLGYRLEPLESEQRGSLHPLTGTPPG